MKVSICIPAYGRVEMLLQALHSILIQDYKNYEVIIRDDESSLRDDAEFARLLAFFGDRAKYFYESHLGTFSKVANATLRHATGDILHIMGSDDLMAPHALAEVIQEFQNERYGGPCWLYGRTISTDHNLVFDGIDGATATYEEMLQANRIGLPSVFWNRQIMDLTGGFDERYQWAADYDLWLTFFYHRPPIFINRNLGIFRHHTAQMSVERAAEIEDEAQQIAERHAALGLDIAKERLAKLIENENIAKSHDG